MAWDAAYRDKEMDSDMHFCVASDVAFKKLVPGYSAEKEVKQDSSIIWVPSYSRQCKFEIFN